MPKWFLPTTPPFLHVHSTPTKTRRAMLPALFVPPTLVQAKTPAPEKLETAWLTRALLETALTWLRALQEHIKLKGTPSAIAIIVLLASIKMPRAAWTANHARKINPQALLDLLD
jgi:hypothetical protein